VSRFLDEMSDPDEKGYFAEAKVLEYRLVSHHRLVAMFRITM